MKVFVYAAMAMALAALAGCSSTQPPSRSPTTGSTDGATAASYRPAMGGELAAEDEPLTLAPGASLDERVDLARQIAGRLRLRSDRVQRWLRDARLADPGPRTRCLDDLLSQVHAVEREGDVSHRTARAAGSRRDPESVDRELERLQVFDERSGWLQVRADQCGKPATFRPAPSPTNEVRSYPPSLPAEPRSEARAGQTTTHYRPQVR